MKVKAYAWLRSVKMDAEEMRGRNCKKWAHANDKSVATPTTLPPTTTTTKTINGIEPLKLICLFHGLIGRDYNVTHQEELLSRFLFGRWLAIRRVKSNRCAAYRNKNESKVGSEWQQQQRLRRIRWVRFRMVSCLSRTRRQILIVYLSLLSLCFIGFKSEILFGEQSESFCRRKLTPISFCRLLLLFYYIFGRLLVRSFGRSRSRVCACVLFHYISSLRIMW